MCLYNACNEWHNFEERKVSIWTQGIWSSMNSKNMGMEQVHEKQQWLWVLWASASWAKASWARASASISAAAAWVVSRWTTRESFSLLLAALNSVQQEDHSHSQQHQWLLLQVISSCLHTIGMNLGASGLGNSLVISKRLSAQGWQLNWSPPHTLHWRAQRRQVMYIGFDQIQVLS